MLLIPSTWHMHHVGDDRAAAAILLVCCLQPEVLKASNTELQQLEHHCMLLKASLERLTNALWHACRPAEQAANPAVSYPQRPAFLPSSGTNSTAPPFFTSPAARPSLAGGSSQASGPPRFFVPGGAQAAQQQGPLFQHQPRQQQQQPRWGRGGVDGAAAQLGRQESAGGGLRQLFIELWGSKPSGMCMKGVLNK